MLSNQVVMHSDRMYFLLGWWQYVKLSNSKRNSAWSSNGHHHYCLLLAMDVWFNLLLRVLRYSGKNLSCYQGKSENNVDKRAETRQIGRSGTHPQYMRGPFKSLMTVFLFLKFDSRGMCFHVCIFCPTGEGSRENDQGTWSSCWLRSCGCMK